MATGQTRLQISGEWSDAQAVEGEFFLVHFDLQPHTDSVRVDEVEVLRLGEEFFRELFRAFIRSGGRIHAHTTPSFGDIHQWPRLATDEAEVDGVLGALLARRDASPYPLVVWFEPGKLRQGGEINEGDLQAAAHDMEMLHELIGTGLPRLFLDEEWADLLADPEDRHWIRAWIEDAAAVSAAAFAKFDF